MRIHALLRCSASRADALCETLNELQERNWIKVRWRTPRRDLPERLLEVDRIPQHARVAFRAAVFCHDQPRS